MQNKNVELINLLNSISNVAQKLADSKQDERFTKIANAAKFIKSCKDADVEASDMLLLMQHKGYLSSKQVNSILQNK